MFNSLTQDMAGKFFMQILFGSHYSRVEFPLMNSELSEVAKESPHREIKAKATLDNSIARNR
jgi:hypothetical protein